MIDRAQQPVNGPSLDFQAHLAVLENKGLLVRIDRPINKDTELHPLVRWQFLGGIPEDERRAFLFTNVVNSRGRRYDIPVVVGALAASPRIYAIGMGCPIEEIGATWMRAIANPIAPVVVSSPPCQEVVATGDDLRQPTLELPARERMQLGVLVDRPVDAREQPARLEPRQMLLEIARRPGGLTGHGAACVCLIEHSTNL